jgi:general secretion pathway protein H
MTPRISAIGNPARSGGTTQAGVTLLELMVVLAIMGLLAALAGPVLSRRATSPATVARDVVTALREARVEALTRRRPIAFWLDAAKRSYGVGEKPSHSLPADMRIKFESARTSPQDRGEVIFFADGRTTGGRISIQAAERRSVVDVDWLDGLVRRTND